MNQSRIEQTIEEIYTFIEECKASKLYPNKVVVAKDELYDMLDALRLSAPEEIKRYKKIISNRDAILNEATEKANHMVNNAQSQTMKLLDQSEIVQEAYKRANELMEDASKRAEQMMLEANEDAERIRNASLLYTNGLLTDAENIIQAAKKEFAQKYISLESAMKYNLDIIRKNKEELMIREDSKELAQTEQNVLSEEVNQQEAENASETGTDEFTE